MIMFESEIKEDNYSQQGIQKLSVEMIFKDPRDYFLLLCYFVLYL